MKEDYDGFVKFDKWYDTYTIWLSYHVVWVKRKKARRDLQNNQIYTNLKQTCVGIGQINT